MSRLIYIAAPIDQGRVADEHVGHLAHAITRWGHAVYLPGRAFMVGPKPTPDRRLELVNREALENADALVAVLPKGAATIGTPREIEAFAQAGKPWAVMTDNDASFSLADAHYRTALDDYALMASWADTAPVVDPAFDSAPLLFTKVDPYDGTLPTRAYDGDAAFDLYAAADTHIPYQGFRDVPCGVRVALPDGVWGRIVGRSSTLRNRRLLISEGIIDGGWRGPLFAGAQNLGDKATLVKRGDRIAQFILMPNLAAMFRPQWTSAAHFATIPHDGRGDNGFGSTGI